VRRWRGGVELRRGGGSGRPYHAGNGGGRCRPAEGRERGRKGSAVGWLAGARCFVASPLVCCRSAVDDSDGALSSSALFRCVITGGYSSAAYAFGGEALRYRF
jgi:hypothetical protein